MTFFNCYCEQIRKLFKLITAVKLDLFQLESIFMWLWDCIL